VTAVTSVGIFSETHRVSDRIIVYFGAVAGLHFILNSIVDLRAVLYSLPIVICAGILCISVSVIRLRVPLISRTLVVTIAL
jgi:RsiW-degrading membrane proteinase PrsW (M82 family)